jgi:signal peptidase I
MMPNLGPGRNVIILKHIPADGIHPGDIIVFESPVDGTLVIKRCAGIGGEQIMNGNTAIAIPPQTVFALGDNSDRSKDSRHYGTVPVSAIKGKVIFPIIGGSARGE